jgi:HEAT repeat protein
MRRPLAALALALALAPGAAAAQPRSGVAGHRPSERRNEPAALHTLVGIPVAQRLLQSDDAATRVRGVERLGAIGTNEAIDALVEILEQNSPWMRDPRIRLTAVRVLAGETKRDNVRRFLTREVTDTAGADGRGGVSPIAGLLRSTAALALARGGEKESLTALITALLQGGAPADAATRALRVYPPASLESFLEGRKRLTPALATFLGELGDLRALERLRAMLGEGDVADKLAAAVALARLGDDAALVPAREWLAKSDPRLRRTAAEVFVALDAPEAGPAVAALLDTDATRDEGLRLALAAPSPGLAAPLARALPSMPAEMRVRAVAALGRARGVAELTPLLDHVDTATRAAFALATMPGDDARAALERALADKAKKGEPRRTLIRAGTVRALVLDDAPDGLRAALRGLLKEQAPSDRAAGAFGLVATGALSLDDAIESACKPAVPVDHHGTRAVECDTAIVAAAARGALALPAGSSSLEPLSPLLASAAAQTDPHPSGGAGEALAVAAGVVLLAHPDGGELPTSVLAAWAEGGGPLSPLAARALPSRDDDALRGRIKRLLEGTDPVVRAHLALGLARDPEPSATSLLTSAYRFEEDAGVRRAVVRALSRRAEVQRLATLALARDLDPDDEVRSLARTALAGRAHDPGLRPALGVEPRRSVAWVTIAPSEGRTGKDQPLRTARMTRSDGLSVPAVADPDGVLLVPGLPPGPASLLLGR